MHAQKRSSVFITGASGFIGANLTRSLLKNNYSVHILNRTKNLSWRLKDIENLITVHSGDIVNFDSVKEALKESKPDNIIHLATYGAYHFQTEFEKIVQVNIDGIKNLLEASKDIQYKTFINTGSSSEYGYKNKAMKETDACNPISYYAATKNAATQICKVFSRLTINRLLLLGYFQFMVHMKHLQD